MYSIKKKFSWIVTGGAGFIGSNLCKFLIKNNQKVICIDNLFSGSKKNIKNLDKYKNFKFIKCDIRNLKLKSIFQNVDYIVHLAALGSVLRSIKNPSETNSVNVDGSINILEIAKKIKVKKFIFASSSSVYGNSKKEYKVEDDETYPISPYGVSKLSFEKYAEVISKNSKIKTVGLRFFNVFGPNQNIKGAYAAVIPLWCSRILKNKSINLNGDGTTARDFTYIDNVLEGIIRSCFFQQKKSLEIFNLACGEEISLKTLLKNIKMISKKDFKIIKKPFRAGDIKRSKANIDKAKKMINYYVNTNFSEGLEKYIEANNFN